MNYLKRRASEEKQNIKMNKSNSSQKRNQVMYQEFMGVKSRSPQNQGGISSKIDYYMVNN